MATASVKTTESAYGSQNSSGNSFSNINYSDVYVGHPPNDEDSAGYVGRWKFPSISYASTVTNFKLYLYFKSGYTATYRVYVSNSASLTPYQVVNGSATLLGSKGITPADGGSVTTDKWYTLDLSSYIDSINNFTGNWYLYLYKPAGAAGRSIFQGGTSTEGAYLALTYTTYTACTAPTSASLAASLTEGEVSCTYSGAAGGTANAITGFEYQYAESTDNATWGSWTNLKTVSDTDGSGTTTLAPHGTRGRYRRYQMRTQGAAGPAYYSAWKAISGTVRRNQTPGTPTAAAPAASSTVYNSKPYVVASIGAEPDNQTQQLQVRIDGGDYVNLGAALTGAGGTVRAALTTTLAPGSRTLAMRFVDSMGVAGPELIRVFTVDTLSWARTIASGSVISGPGVSHIAEIQQLLTRVNTVRGYYGLAAITLPGTLGAFKDWLPQMQALRAGLNACYTAAGRAAPSWIQPDRNAPRADVFNELRAALPAA